MKEAPTPNRDHFLFEKLRFSGTPPYRYLLVAFFWPARCSNVRRFIFRYTLVFHPGQFSPHRVQLTSAYLYTWYRYTIARRFSFLLPYIVRFAIDLPTLHMFKCNRFYTWRTRKSSIVETDSDCCCFFFVNEIGTSETWSNFLLLSYIYVLPRLSPARYGHVK